MADLLEREHAELLATAVSLVEELRLFGGRIDTANVTYEQHRVYADRAHGLSEVLAAILDLTTTNRYAPAFGLLRTALEQVVFDRLLCLATTLVETIDDVPDATYDQWRADKKAGADWTKPIRKMERVRETSVRLEMLGVRSSDPGNRATLSVYFFLLKEYRPFVSPAKDQARLLPEFRKSDREIEYAKRQNELYHASLRWPALISNLRMNNLVSDADAFRIGIHYRFLSGFVHPLADQSRLLYGRSHDTWPRPYDHYSSELGLLYVAALAIFELGTLMQARVREPSFNVADPGVILERISAAKREIAYLWFVGDEPHSLDRIGEANRRYWANDTPNPTDLVDPGSLEADEVRYYQNPLRRLIDLHKSTNEMMGHSFVSPWPRQDAWFR